MNIRDLVKKEVEKFILNEFRAPFSSSFKRVPNTFDHLKWTFNSNQKFYLQDLCEVDPNSLTESDYGEASKVLGITPTNVKSIINTYNTYSPFKEAGQGDSSAAMNSRLTFGNKAANAFDIGIENNSSKGPIKSKIQINNNPPTMSKSRMDYEAYKDEKNTKLYRVEMGEEHPSKSRERFYENLNKSLMMYLFCEANPSDINLREDDKIQLEFSSVIEENNFNKLTGGPNYENNQHKFINKLLKEFNDKFGCSYVIYDHIKTENGIKIFVEHNITKQVDMSQDSMAMMKKFLIPKIMTGHKIESNDPSVASLMGLDAGDTNWLYGKIGEPMNSGILSKKHRGKA
jgi:hypothetical protein